MENLTVKESSATSNIKDINSVLLKTLDGLVNNTVDENKARVICQVAQTILNSAKVEISYKTKFGGLIMLDETKKD